MRVTKNIVGPIQALLFSIELFIEISEHKKVENQDYDDGVN